MLRLVNFAGVNRGLSTPATAIQPAAGQADDVDDCRAFSDPRPSLQLGDRARGSSLLPVAAKRHRPRTGVFPPCARGARATAVAGRPPPNMAEFARRLRQQRLVPVGVQNGDEAWMQAALNAGLGLFPALNDNQQAPCAKRMGSAGGNGCECSSPGPPAMLAQS
jgi:hypothetical protein